jgi:hypothetical protein
MTNPQIATLVRTAIHRIHTCPRHEIHVPRHEHCYLCILESYTGRFQRTINQVMRGVVAPSWERERL